MTRRRQALARAVRRSSRPPRWSPFPLVGRKRARRELREAIRRRLLVAPGSLGSDPGFGCAAFELEEAGVGEPAKGKR